MLYTLILIIGTQSFVVDRQLTMDDCRATISENLRGSFSDPSRLWIGDGFYAEGPMTAVCVPERNNHD